MCNPYGMAAMSLMQMQRQKDALKAQREDTKKSYERAASAEGAREDQEALAIRMEADKITRETGRAAGETSVVMAGAGVEIVGLVEQWGQLEQERLGTLSAKERMLAVAGDYRMEELISARDQRLAAAAAPETEDYLMAGITGWIQGSLIQKQLSSGEGADVAPGEEVSFSDYFKDIMNKLASFATTGIWGGKQ